MILLSILFRKIIGPKNWRLNRYEILILAMAGVFRGCVAYAQISSIEDSHDEEGNQIMKGSVNLIIAITNLTVGAIFPYFVKWNLKQIQNTERYTPDHPSIKDPLISSKILNKKKQQYVMRAEDN